MAKDKTSEKTSDSVALVPQPHGGALKPGGNGKSGGRPTSVFRAKCRKGAIARYPDLNKIASGKMKGATVADQLRAIEMLIKHGFAPVIPIQDVRERMQEIIGWAESTLDEETADKLITQLRSIWHGAL